MIYTVPQLNELMVVLMEECAEVQQTAAKIARFGLTEEKLESLQNELGDLQCMVELIKEAHLITQAGIDAGAAKKREKLKVYSSLIG